MPAGATRPAASRGEWRAYGSDGGGSRYSPLAEINRDNVKDLKVAWTYRAGEDSGANSENAAFEATPIIDRGTLYLSTPYNRVIALDAATGRERWQYDPKVDRGVRYSEVTSRGVSIWQARLAKNRARCHRRVFIATLDARLIALDADDGKPCEDFGDQGQIDLKRDVRFTEAGAYVVTSPPAILNDLVIVGSAIGDNRGVEQERGVVRAFNARTGKLVWSWDPIPQNAGDPARQSWAGESAMKTGAANAWSIITVDEQRDIVFIPTSSPSPDFYGGERIGDNNYANSVAALRGATGRLLWHFQVVHHDLWDYDVASQPTLVTVKQGGTRIPAVAVATKMGHVFVLNRLTGKPVFPVEERAVPISDVSGEQAARTQPFPILPAPLSPFKLSIYDAWGITPTDRQWCEDRLKEYRNEGIFTPPSLKGSLFYPGNVGGMHWGSMSYDPVRNLLIVNTNRLATIVRLIPRSEADKVRASSEGQRLRGEFGRQSGTPYVMYREPFLSPSGLPCNPPPWGTLAAIDLNDGSVRWEVPLGTFAGLANHPQAKEWGSINLGGAMTTGGGLVFIAAAMDTVLRAYDVETGKEVWQAELPASAQATPMSYQVGNRQFIAICAGGHGRLRTKRGDYVVAYALP